MNHGYEMIKEVLEIAVYSIMCFQILGLKRKETRYFWGIMIAFHVLAWACLWGMKADYMIVVPVCTLLEIGLPTAVAEGKFAKRITTVFLSYTVMSIANMIVGLGLKSVMDISQHARQIISIVMIFVLIIILCILQSVYKIRFIDVNEISTAIILAFGLFGLGVSAFISNVLRSDFDSRGAVYVNIIAIAILIVSFLFCFMALLLMGHKKVDIEQMNQENKSIIESQQKYVQEILNDREEIRRMYHDLDKIVLTLNTLFESGHYDEALMTLKRLNQELNGSRHQFVYTNDELADAVISQYAGIAEKQDITFHVKVKADKKPVLQGYDFCIILSNLLSNAVEAAAAARKKRQVSLLIKQNQDQWYIRVENTYCADYSNTKFNFSTRNGSQHGYGLKNVRAAVDRLGGEVYFGTEGEYVIVEVFLVED